MNTLKPEMQRRENVTITINPTVKKLGAKVALERSLSLSRLIEILLQKEAELSKKTILVESK